ncbi:MAG TPA: ABC transporter permease [Pyrinomonadaceae bacterium]|jgi:putative ABC transport system permease protein|nr:ABC transporter permease [Pyrinomonadaceae bacterium]
MGNLWQDVRYGFRTLVKSPGFTLVALAALALGIGANTAIFSVINAVLLRSLPYRDTEQVMIVWEQNRARDGRNNVVSPANFLDWREQAKSFQEMGAFYDVAFNLTGDGNPEEIPAQVTTGNLLTMIGTEAALGRVYTKDEAEPGRDDVVVISHGLWQRRFGGASDIINKRISLNGQGVIVLGVMPEGFKWFMKEGSRTGKAAEIWTPTKFEPTLSTSNAGRGRFITVAGRLKPGVTPKQAQTEMDAIAARLEQQHPRFNTNMGVHVVPVREQLAGEIKLALYVLLGAVGFVLLIACANVANLMLARAASRQSEFAIRTALGAGRGRMVRQLLTESVLLSVGGGALGLLIALWGVDALVALSPPNLLGTERIGTSLPVLGFTFAVSLLTGIVFGLAPALEATRLNLNETLKETGKSNMSSRRSKRLSSVFVVAQVALALVLLIGSTLMIKSFLRLQAVDPGFQTQNLLTLRVTVPGSKYPKDPQIVGFFRQALERLRSLPDVRSVGAVSALPFGGNLGARTSFFIEGQPAPPPGQEFSTDVRATDEYYFQTIGIPLVSGRTFNEQEAKEDRRVFVINEALARQFFPGENPLGKYLRVEMEDNPEPRQIIGVVADAKYKSLEGVAYPMVYVAHPHLAYSEMTFVMRTNGDPLNLAAAARREIQMIDKDQPVADVRTMQSWIDELTARSRFGTLLLGIFAALALVLAAIGIYGVMSYSVTQRTHELGIRIALGAKARDVLALILGRGLALTLTGIALGLVASFALTRFLSSLLFGISATDPVTFGGLSLLLTAVALVACYVPTRRAMKVDPMVALRNE